MASTVQHVVVEVEPRLEEQVTTLAPSTMGPIKTDHPEIAVIFAEEEVCLPVCSMELNAVVADCCSLKVVEATMAVELAVLEVVAEDHLILASYRTI